MLNFFSYFSFRFADTPRNMVAGESFVGRCIRVGAHRTSPQHITASQSEPVGSRDDPHMPGLQ